MQMIRQTLSHAASKTKTQIGIPNRAFRRVVFAATSHSLCFSNAIVEQEVHLQVSSSGLSVTPEITSTLYLQDLSVGHGINRVEDVDHKTVTCCRVQYQNSAGHSRGTQPRFSSKRSVDLRTMARPWLSSKHDISTAKSLKS
eukprot:Gb_04825 [translate_table: standard]